MNPFSWFGMALHLSVTALLVWAPYVKRGGIFFGVRTGPDFPRSAEAHTALRRYRISMTAVGIAASAFLLYFGMGDIRPQLGAMQATALAAILLFAAEYRRMRRFAAPPEAASVRVIELSTASDRLPLVGWLSIIPLLWMIGVVLYMAGQWEQIPARYPVHWNIHGIANRWSEKTLAGIFAAPLFFIAMAGWCGAFGLASWFGARRSEPMRKPMLVAMSLSVLALGVLQPLIALLPLTGAPKAGFIPAIVIFVLLSIAGPVHLIRQGQFTKPQRNEPLTPDANWTAGLWYANRDDAALFVGSRAGVGLTLNMARAWSWILLLAPLVLLVTLWWTVGSAVARQEASLP